MSTEHEFNVGDTVYFPGAGIARNRVRPYTVASVDPLAVYGDDPNLHFMGPDVITAEAVVRLGMTRTPPDEVQR